MKNKSVKTSMSQQTIDVKIVLLGATSVGKTCIVTRAISDYFDPEQTPTVGASFSIKTVVVNDTTMNLRIWDTAGQERFKSLAPMYYQGSQAAIIVFSIVDEESFKEAEYWVNELKTHFTTPPHLFLVGNKLDLNESRVITPQQGEARAGEIGATYFETSAKSGQNISELFENIADHLLTTKESDTPTQSIDSTPQNQKCGC